MKKLVLMLLMLTLMAACCQGAGASSTSTDPISYINENGETVTLNESYTLYTSEDSNTTEEKVLWGSGWYVIEGDVTLPTVQVTGSVVNLILKDNCHLKTKGIIVALSKTDDSGYVLSTLNIFAQSTNPDIMGSLTSQPVNDASLNMAAIGASGSQGDCGHIVINGGRITAHGGDEPGIGPLTNPNLGFGSLTVNGGIITADGIVGIGNNSGYVQFPITIRGGQITASTTYSSGDHSAIGFTSRITYKPSGENAYILVRDITKDGKIVKAYPYSDSSDAISSKYKQLLFEKATLGKITIDSAQQTRYVDDSDRSFTVVPSPSSVSPDSFSVLYRVSGTYGPYSAEAPSAPGIYEVKVTRGIDSSFLAFSQTIQEGLSIVKRSNPSVPAAAAVNETKAGQCDGKLTGVDSTMEYCRDGDTAYTAITGNEVTGLTAGSYAVRFRETDTHLASADQVVVVSAEYAAYETDNTIAAKSINADNVRKDQAETIELALADLIKAKEQLGGSAPASLFRDISRLRAAKTALDDVSALESAVAALPACAGPGSQHETTIRQLLSDYNGFREHQKSLVDSALREKLLLLNRYLSQYLMLEGAHVDIVMGEKTALTFRCNGEFGLFSGVDVDGKPLDASCYTAASGSTVVTLAPSYVMTLSAGAHQLAINYKDGGSAGASINVKSAAQEADLSIDTSSLPQTGDSSNLVLWLVLGAACAVCVVLIVMRRRK